MRYESKEDLAGKVDWEGGVAEAITGYGITTDMLPEDAPGEIVRAWRRIEESGKDIDAIQEWLDGGDK